ncbi:MAG: hypothetical protein JSR71_02430 [Proteobacteria bacterium]|nr:hypothetical protein [Pseudomonadota bacterium]
MKLTGNEKYGIIKLLKADRLLLDKYCFLLFNKCMVKKPSDVPQHRVH